jgi:hypothetical protein
VKPNAYARINYVVRQFDLFTDQFWGSLSYLQRVLLVEQLNLLHRDADFRATTDLFVDLPPEFQSAVLDYFQMDGPPIHFTAAAAEDRC